MTPKELNRDVRALWFAIDSKLIDVASTNGKEYQEFITIVAKQEFKRLYSNDPTFSLMNKESIKTMFRLNLRYRWISLHSFGLFIKPYAK